MNELRRLRNSGSVHGYVAGLEAELSSLRSRNSELVEGIKRKVALLRAKSRTSVGLMNTYQKNSAKSLLWLEVSLAEEEAADELESLLPPDPATTNSKEKI